MRQQVLEAHGWIIHRIWSADWYLRPQEELKKVEEAIAIAKAEWRERDEEGFQSTRAVPVSFEGEEVGDFEVVTASIDYRQQSTQTVVPYVEAEFSVNRSHEPHEAPLAEMAGYVVKIVDVEGPVHIDEIVTRVRTLWGLARAGNRIRSAIDRAVDVALQRNRIEGKTFYSVPGKAIQVRDRSNVRSVSLRKPEMLPPDEVDEAIVTIVDENFGAGRDELIHALSRALGYASTSSQLKKVFEERIDNMLLSGRLAESDGLLTLAK